MPWRSEGGSLAAWLAPRRSTPRCRSPALTWVSFVAFSSSYESERSSEPHDWLDLRRRRVSDIAACGTEEYHAYPVTPRVSPENGREMGGKKYCFDCPREYLAMRRADLSSTLVTKPNGRVLPRIDKSGERRAACGRAWIHEITRLTAIIPRPRSQSKLLIFARVYFLMQFFKDIYINYINQCCNALHWLHKYFIMLLPLLAPFTFPPAPFFFKKKLILVITKFFTISQAIVKYGTTE